MSILFACICVPHAVTICRDQKRELDSLGTRAKDGCESSLLQQQQVLLTSGPLFQSHYVFKCLFQLLCGGSGKEYRQREH